MLKNHKYMLSGVLYVKIKVDIIKLPKKRKVTKMNKRLIASTMTQRVYPLAEAVDKLLEIGFDTVELCSPHFNVSNPTEESVKETANIFKTTGMKLHCINIGFFKDLPVENMEYVYMLAKEAGAKVVTYGCGEVEEGKVVADLLKIRADYNSKLADYADKYGVICSIEAPHKLSLAETSEQVDAYWALQDKRVHCTFDTAHLTYSGGDMIATAKKYAQRIAHSHLRDAVKGNSLKRYGEGVVDFQKYFDTLREAGYTGKFSMEYPPETKEEAAERLITSTNFLSKFNI